jgi:hypothetical protein
LAVNDYNTAQFDLYRALGEPAQWVTSLKWQPPAPPSEPAQPPTAVNGANARRPSP